ncbi:alpha-2-macroglobulin receptor-associated protein [Orycteropus afer afer]|uniref:Alpha-2-macroglobulin receptor-associated protein n=1 Tax=Orycteropus afer afer TaxID=1230840 RepID=A0AC54ZCD2_ORYAF|nr:alpha-2-macroglobulin receptor-associated protein [Orycteropus afer afer]
MALKEEVEAALKELVAVLMLVLLPPLLLGPAPAAGHGGKYSREKNEPAPPPKRESEEFRMEKLNQLWEKARRVSGPVTLTSLHADLKMQERDELGWKKLKVEGLDEDGEKEARLIRNLNGSFVFNVTGGGTGRSFAVEIHKNVISPSDMSHIKEEVLQSRHAELKDRLRAINQGFDRLRKVSHQGYDAESEFEEPRVIELWDLAKSANFTKKELEAFREELRHFEAKVEKHQHYQKQLELSHQKLRHVEGGGDRELLTRSREKYALLEEKAKELGYKVKKHLQDLAGRVSRSRHNEL